MDNLNFIYQIFNSDFIQKYMTIPQLIGILGYLVGVSAFLQRKDSAFRWQLTIVNIIMTIHFYLLGPESYPAAILNIVNIFRNIASAYTKNMIVMLFFIGLMWIFYFLTTPDWTQFIHYLSVIGTTLVTIALFRFHQQQMRLLILLSSALWIIYSLWIDSLGSLAIEVTFAIINIVTIIKLSKNR
ncbi:YgjV family protein [Gilliamella sp. wkB108]|uniref:YgjV family protein n=2 Tax=Gilliamella sp. wkB108 TaxID=3120256 RepID=UPI0009BDF40A|nr:YgjV family protein [Gilliamella apicola]